MFCSSCGKQIPDDTKFCPFCGAPVDGANASTPVEPTPVVNATPVNNTAAQSTPQTPLNEIPVAKAKNGGLVLLISILSLVFAVLGTILWGYPLGIIALALGIVGAVLSVNIRKETNNTQGIGALVCSILGIVFAVLFSISCFVCGSCSCGTGAYGCIGSACVAKCRGERLVNDVERGLNDAADYFENINEDDLEDALDELQNMFK